MFDFLTEKFSSVFSRLTGARTLTEKNIQESLEKVHQALLEADVPLKVVDDFIAQTSQEIVGQKVLKALKPGEQFIKVVHERLTAFLGGAAGSAPFSFQIPSVIMVLGLQGSGKTTTIAKLAYTIAQQAKTRGKSRNILMASVDFYRPAAVDQLEILAQQVSATFYRSSKTAPLDAVRDIYAYFRQHNFELLLLDTAGRLHIDSAMMRELQDIDTYLKPKYKILVLDAMTGQESLQVAQAFDQAVGFHGSILTKMDSGARGGAALAFRYTLKKPIFFVGSGEKISDLEQFYPDRMAQRILGMGDVLTLVEKAQASITQQEQDKAHKAFVQGRLTLQDFADQLDMVGKLGSLSNIVKYMPGIAGEQVSPQMLEKGEQEMVRFRAIINSMTLKERQDHRILDGSRKMRIARGAGVVVADVNALLDRFEESQQYVKLFKNFGRFNKLFK
jgi:signal recognition particle subunit SRP54